MNNMLFRSCFSTVSKCPYCQSFDLMHIIGSDIITCVGCNKKFTKEEAQQITGIVEYDRDVYESQRRLL